MSKEKCPCGRPLHYATEEQQRDMQAIIDQQGTHIHVSNPANPKGGWSVPRHFIALHGIHDDTIAEDAERYGFEAV